MALDIKQAIQIGRIQFRELLPELSMESSDVRAEEIEKEGRNWAIMFSVPTPNAGPQDVLAGTLNARGTARIAKIIVVDGEDGQFVTLRQRAA